VADRHVWYPHTCIPADDFTRILLTANYAIVQATGQSKTCSDRASCNSGALHDGHFLYADKAHFPSGSSTS